MKNEITVQQIHNEFDSAQERLLSEAKEIANKPHLDISKKAERCNKLGFTSSKTSKLAEGIVKRQLEAAELLKNINYFKEKYPLNKFITEQEVKRICGKYGLILGDASRFISDIPEKNIKEIESFKLRKEDFIEEVVDWNQSIMDGLLSGSWRARSFRVDAGMADWGRNNFTVELEGSGLQMDDATRQKQSKNKPAFKVVAREEDFNTEGMRISGHKLENIPDPIVLQPVKGGYLIVTAWGDEASDEAVVNEKMN